MSLNSKEFLDVMMLPMHHVQTLIANALNFIYISNYLS